jgi:putative transposase
MQLSITKHGKLLDVSRSGLYYKPSGISHLNLELIRLIDEHYLEHLGKGA